MKSLYAAALFAAVLATSPAKAETVPFDDPRWEFSGENHKLETYKGKQALYLEKSSALLENANFKDGTIEFDVAFPNARSFVYLQFRRIDARNSEEFYLRPVQSGRPDANQYTPVFNGMSAWQLYHSPEYSTPTVYNFDEWMHVKLVIKGSRADVYIDSEEPVLQIPFLKREPQSGGVSLRSIIGEGTHFANLSFKQQANPPITEMEISAEEPIPGLVTDWQVSSTIAEDAPFAPNSADLSWQAASTERGGFVNFARYSGRTREINTVYARMTVNADAARTQKIDFGYSDRVRVYVNGTLTYSGDNTYRTRDFRYLGTVGFFDSVHARLKKGDNEIIFAVAESFGGWGVMARLSD